MPDGKFPLIRAGLLNSNDAHPRCNLTWPWSADSSPVSCNSRPHCSRNNCFAVMLAMALVSCCTSEPFCQLKGYLDLLTVTKWLNRGQTLHSDGRIEFFWMHVLHPGRKSSVIHQGQSSLSQIFAVRRVHKGLNSGVDCLLHSWLAELECNTVNYSGLPAKSIHRTQVYGNFVLAFPETHLLVFSFQC